MERIPIPMGHGHKANKETNAQTHTQERINAGKCLTQFYVLIISEDEDDVGSDIADVAVPLQSRPEAISRQVARALGHREDFHQDKKEEKWERGREPPPCHHATLLSPPQSFDSHTGVCSTQPARRRIKYIHTHTQNTVKNSRCKPCTAITGCSSVQMHPFGLSSAR